jgi:rare lipoprotein A (peptidoglycan hydrolase)
VKINDRGPFHKGRDYDLSRAAARAIGCSGVCNVSVGSSGFGGWDAQPTPRIARRHARHLIRQARN